MRDLAAAIQDAWDFGDPAGSEARFAAMVRDAERDGDEAAAAEIRTQLARAQGLQRRFDDANATLEAVEPLLNREPALRVRVRHALERGRVFNSTGDAHRATGWFTRAWMLASAPMERPQLDSLAVDAAHMLAIADPANADDWNRKALDLAESSPNPDARRWRASLLNNIGWTHFSSGNYAAALAHFERALAARVEQGTTGKFRGPWLIARWCVAKAKRVLGQLDEALAEQQKLAAEHAAAGTSDGFVHEELGECLLALGRDAEAAPHFARAHALLSGDVWLAGREPDRLTRLKRLATPPASG